MRYRNVILFSVLILLGVFSIACSFCLGSISIPFHHLLSGLNSQHPNEIHDILYLIRIPRTLTAFITGSLLGLAGGLMQILLRNPLADPYILGVSGGAAISTLLLLLLGVDGIYLTGGAWTGALLTIFLVFILSHSNKVWNNQRILLTGVACASGFSAFISFILLISPDKELRSMLFWLMGDLSYAHIPLKESVLLIAALGMCIWLGPQLNILLRGEKEACALGINTKRLNITLYFISSGLTATAVTLGGCIGFVGLIVPHILRLLDFHDQRLLLPAAALLGGSLLTFADLLSRCIWSPQQLPVGIMMVMLGVPIFLALLHKTAFK